MQLDGIAGEDQTRDRRHHLYAGKRSAKNYAFVDAVARKNVEMTVAGIRQDSSVLAELEAKGAVKMAGAMYNLETGAVEFFD